MNKILLEMMPLYKLLYYDKVFDEVYVLKGSTFIISIIFLPLTGILWGIGRMFSRK